MALIDKSRGTGKSNFPRLVKMEVGETVTGHVVGFDESTVNPGAHYIVMQLENGEKISVSAKGNLRYRREDGDIEVGQLTTITRNPDRKSKNGKNVSDFYFAQDPDNTIEVESELDAAGVTNDLPKMEQSKASKRASELAKQINSKN